MEKFNYMKSELSKLKPGKVIMHLRTDDGDKVTSQTNHFIVNPKAWEKIKKILIKDNH